jgi:hypothetical protein
VPVLDAAGSPRSPRRSSASVPRRQLRAPAPGRARADLREVGSTLASATTAGSRTSSVGTRAPEFLERLTRDFPRFDDTATYDGRHVRFWKLAQLSVWILEANAPGRHRLPGPRPPDGVRRLHRPGGAAGARDHALLGRAGGRDARGPRDRGGLTLGGGDPRAHDLGLRGADPARERAAPAGATRDRPAGGRRLWVPFHRTHYPHHLTKTIYY